MIAIVALLLFGKRLPEVGRSLGKGIIEFKKGLAGIEEDVTQSVPAGHEQADSGGVAPGDRRDTNSIPTLASRCRNRPRRRCGLIHIRASR